MGVDLPTLPLAELIQKFAAGGHKPGSGSAVALLGLISCALTKTVVGLSRDRNDYQHSWTTLEAIGSAITNEIEPALWRAFVNDSTQFDNVITARRARDNERSPHQRWRFARSALNELHAANEIPLLVAEQCSRLAEYAVTVFDVGFNTARGDSAVAIDSAISGITGAISIVYLNLASFRGDDKAVNQLRRAETLEERARNLRSQFHERSEHLKSVAKINNSSVGIDLKIIRDSNKLESEYLDSDIEEIARNIQNELWAKRRKIEAGIDANDELSILDPEVAFRVLGYTYETSPTLGKITDGGELVEVAGYINKEERYAAVSRKCSSDVRRFTAAHELGHAVLHKANEQFRDRALDGAMARSYRSHVEYEADKFAAYFLMPASLMRKLFRELFRADQFVVSDQSAFALGAANAAQLLNQCPSIRHLSLRLAKTIIFADRSVNSLAKTFRVSNGAIAIRIEELKMIDTNGYPFH